MISEFLSKPGVHELLIHHSCAMFECEITIPEQANTDVVAIIGHPHSLQGGTMNNKVVTTLARMFKDLGIVSLRFNFRGVGKSTGEYNAGVGESEDMCFLANAILKDLPKVHFIFSGFSFGSYVAYRAACQMPHRLLISIAPPVPHYNYQEFGTPENWLIIQGDRDEVVPVEVVSNFVNITTPKPELVIFPETGHFFHGQLIKLKSILEPLVKHRVIG